ncbi:hypothetical protein ACFY1P_00785 [Streptomyces sp. NPDC001407]|uniref:hypothetical protein n=1 Tax=unclassified Streptomyces TaxID=2593676 RepID=UPI0036B331B9
MLRGQGVDQSAEAHAALFGQLGEVLAGLPPDPDRHECDDVTTGLLEQLIQVHYSALPSALPCEEKPAADW